MFDTIYRLIASRVDPDAVVQQVVIGLNWTVAVVANAAGKTAAGLCYSPVNVPRTLPWPGTLAGRRVGELIPWQLQWNDTEAVVATAVANAAINLGETLSATAQPLQNLAPGHLRVFTHFLANEELIPRDANVAVIGHYPGIDSVCMGHQLTILERNPQAGDLPEMAAEQVLPTADWVFITASSLANKTLPRLLELSANARVVLMGPSLPWLTEWREFGVDYLAGVSVGDISQLLAIAGEAGGTRIFTDSVQYRLLSLDEHRCQA